MKVIDELGILEYDTETGEFVWLTTASGRRAGQPAGSLNGSGYIKIRYQKQRHKAHRLAWKMVTGEWPDKDIDHINLNKRDNRFANLRLATRSQNTTNRPASKSNTSGYKGVFWEKCARRWRAQIFVNGKKLHLGLFDCPAKAGAEYQKAAQKHFGEFAFGGAAPVEAP